MFQVIEAALFESEFPKTIKLIDDPDVCAKLQNKLAEYEGRHRHGDTGCHHFFKRHLLEKLLTDGQLSYDAEFAVLKALNLLSEVEFRSAFALISQYNGNNTPYFEVYGGTGLK